PPSPLFSSPRKAIATTDPPPARSGQSQAQVPQTTRSALQAHSILSPPARSGRQRRPRKRSTLPMTRQFQHNSPWSSLDDVWSRRKPDSVVHTIILKDDRPFPPDRIGAGPLPHLIQCSIAACVGPCTGVAYSCSLAQARRIHLAGLIMMPAATIADYSGIHGGIELNEAPPLPCADEIRSANCANQRRTSAVPLNSAALESKNSPPTRRPRPPKSSAAAKAARS